MEKVLETAERSGLAMGLVRNSNHFGIAGYYAMMSLEKDRVYRAGLKEFRELSLV